MSWQLRNSTEKGRFIFCPQSISDLDARKNIRGLKPHDVLSHHPENYGKALMWKDDWMETFCGSLLCMRHKLQLKDDRWSLTQGEEDVPWQLVKAFWQGPRKLTICLEWKDLPKILCVKNYTFFFAQFFSAKFNHSNLYHHCTKPKQMLKTIFCKIVCDKFTVYLFSTHFF